MKIILGKSKSGKSTKIYEYIKEDIVNKKKPILFVPSQTRENTELEYMEYNKTQGVININITTISEFISHMLKKRNIHIEEKYITSLDKKLLLAQIIEENKKDIVVFKNVLKKDGFLDLVNIYMDIFRKNNITNGNIDKLDLKNKILEKKIKEILYIYNKYEKKIDELYIDNVTEANLFAQHIDKFKNFFENATIYFDSYNNFNKTELEFIKSLLNLNLQLTFSINTDIANVQDIYTGNTNDIFETANKTYEKLLAIANSIKDETVENIFLYNNHFKSNKNIKYLSENIYEPIKNKISCDDKSINLNVYGNVYKEVEAVAYIISKKIREGYKYNDFCIYTTNIEDYGSVFSRIFYEYGIPVYMDVKKKISSSKLTEYIFELLDMSYKNLNLDSIIHILKKGLNDFDLDELSYLENYILEFNINKYNIKNKLILNNARYDEVKYDINKINNIRDNAVNVFLGVVQKLKNATSTKDIINILYEHLESNNIFINYYNLSSQLEDKTYFLYSTKADYLVWEKISEVFNSIDKIYCEENITISDFYKLFKMVVSEISIKTLPPTKDKVILADINVTKLGNKKIAFFVGVTDGEFPKKYEEDVLFDDQEIEELNKNAIEFKETSTSKENMGKYNIYEALNNIEKQIYISMPAVNIKNEVTRKSSFISEVENTLDIKMIGEVTRIKNLEIRFEDIYSKEKCFEFMTKKLRYLNMLFEQYDDEKIKKEQSNNLEKQIIEIIDIYNYFNNDEKYNKIMNYLKNDSNLNKNSIEQIYKDDFKSSVYKLEQFKKCPFSYYMKYVLNIKKRKVYEITSMDTGSIMHNVIDEFTKYLIENNIKWKDIIDDNEKIIDVYSNKVKDIICELLKNEFRKQQESVKYGIYQRKLQNTMVKMIGIIAKSFRQSDFEVYGNEIDFSDSSKYTPIVLNLDNNTKMKIIGKIDRVDICKVEDKSYIRVVDYKSSKKSLTLDDIKEGISLQLITYMSDMIDNLNSQESINAIPAACLYFNLSDKIINFKDYTDDEKKIKNEIIKKLRMNGLFIKDIKILENMDKYVNDSNMKMIDITPSRINTSKKVLEENEFEELCKEAKNILKNIGNEILKGVVKIEKNNKEACKFCDFSSICRKDSCI